MSVLSRHFAVGCILISFLLLLMFQVIAGEKRGSAEVEERTGLGHKRVKMRDLVSVLRAEGNLVFLILELLL